MSACLQEWLLRGKTNSPLIIPFNDFCLREYQKEPVKWLKEGIKRIVEVQHRRAGKDYFWLNMTARFMYEKPGIYHYVLPQRKSAKEIIWDGMTSDQRRYMDIFPPELILRKNAQELSLYLQTKNGKTSVFQLIGSDRLPEKLKGRGACWVVFSEAAYQDLYVWYEVYRPMIAENNGHAIFISTPNGMNEFYNLYEMAQANPEWRCRLLTVEDTKAIPLEEIDRMRRERIPEENIQKEMYCSFKTRERAVIYSKCLIQTMEADRIGNFPWHPDFPVYTAWDIGPHTAILFYQKIHNKIYIIDTFYNDSTSLPECIKVVQNKNYLYGDHFAPHDIRIPEYIKGSRLEFARKNGINFSVLPKKGVEEGIHRAMTLFPIMHFHEKTTGDLIHALKNYRREYDMRLCIYREKPRHDWASHYADALRYLAWSYCLEEEGTKTKYDPKKSRWRRSHVRY